MLLFLLYNSGTVLLGTQQASRLLEDFVGELRTLAEKAYLKFNQKFQLELARNQFIQGLKSSGPYEGRTGNTGCSSGTRPKVTHG